MLEKAARQRTRVLLFQRSWGRQVFVCTWILWTNPDKSPEAEIQQVQ